MPLSTRQGVGMGDAGPRMLWIKDSGLAGAAGAACTAQRHASEHELPEPLGGIYHAPIRHRTHGVPPWPGLTIGTKKAILPQQTHHVMHVMG